MQINLKNTPRDSHAEAFLALKMTVSACLSICLRYSGHDRRRKVHLDERHDQWGILGSCWKQARRRCLKSLGQRVQHRPTSCSRLLESSHVSRLSLFCFFLVKWKLGCSSIVNSMSPIVQVMLPLTIKACDNGDRLGWGKTAPNDLDANSITLCVSWKA